MRCKWLTHNDNDRLILIFAGWSSDERLYSHIAIEGWDVLVCHDFDDYRFDAGLLRGYATIYLYAWSLGVHAAVRALDGVKLTAAFAINGTETPRHDSLGIPPATFDATRQHLAPLQLRKFRRRMFDTADEFAQWEQLFGEDADIDALKEQLQLVANVCSEPCEPLKWTRVYISDHDRIFPPEAQLRFWRNHPFAPQIVSLDKAHFVDIGSIIRNTIPDYSKVARRFSRSIETYDENASAQRIIAAKLTSLIADTWSGRARSVLEIGQGSGLFTLNYAPVLCPAEIDFVDLYETPLHHMAPQERMHVADAEGWLKRQERRWDVILSSAAIQWFTNTPSFIAAAADRLEDNGMLACSTFGPGNLSEFDAIRPAPLIYESPSRLLDELERNFREVKVIEEDVVATFATAKDAIMHLQYTGVGGSSRHVTGLSRLLEAVPVDATGRYCLTYKPVYLLARHPRR